MSLFDLCQKYDIQFKKRLGQNLLLDDNINRIMVDAAGITGDDSVLEVGAGLGALTTRLCGKAKRLLSIEIDRTFMPCLEDQFGDMENVRLFRGDVLNHPVEKLMTEFLPGGGPYKMVSNLPYYITAPVIRRFLEEKNKPSSVTLVVQKEVAQRICAVPPDMNLLAVSVQFYGTPKLISSIKRGSFWPTPHVIGHVTL